ncbi:MAG TPA: nucleoid-associated protein [Hanamia sp.]|nr:nucleoid-associated protein [Hanamia sp.]
MISYFQASLSQLTIHKVGNKLLDEHLSLSEHPLKTNDEVLDNLLMNYFLKPFEKVNEVYRFDHPTADLNLNEVYHFAEMIFNDKDQFHENSRQVAKHLYDITNHPKIKSGELYVCYFTGLQIEGESLDAIGIFKSESKEPYLKVIQKAKEFEINYEQEAINIKKLDKGCLIFNTEKEAGYKVAVIDQTNSSEAAYWIDDFLKLKIRNNNYTQTNTVLKVYKDFVTNQIDEEFEISKTDKIDLLNRSIKYFKEKEHFDLDEFSNEVLAHEPGIESFKRFKKNYEDEFETEIGDSFMISDTAVKKQARVYKSVLKLDKNFHIYIHGNKELIEKGYDEQMKMSFYKVYFREEN